MARFAVGIALAASLTFAGAATAQTQAVATVDGRILSSDGSRILYAPTSNPNQLRIRAANGTETVIDLGSQFTPTYGYLSATGATFAADAQGVISDALFNFNAGGLVRVGALDSRDSLRVEGQYAVFSGQLGPQPEAFSSSVFRFDTTTGLLLKPSGSNVNNSMDVTSGGLITYWSRDVFPNPSNIMSFDGVLERQITNSLGLSRNANPLTDGTWFVFIRSFGNFQNTTAQLILSDGNTETVLRDGTSALSYDNDYQITSGWVAFRLVDGTLNLRDPTGATTTLGASSKILNVSEFGEVAYTLGGQTFLRTADGEVWEIGAYGEAFNVGRDWYFYRAGELVRFANGLLVALNADFAGRPNVFMAHDGTTFFGVADIVVPRAIMLEGAATVDTKGFQIGMTGPISGPGRLTVVGGGLLTLRGQNTFTGGIAIGADGRLAGDTVSLSGSIANGGEMTLAQDFNGAFAGVLSGSGLLRKTGAGTVTLGGVQPFNGTTRLEAGGLNLDRIDTASAFVVTGGLLTGQGRIGALNVQNGTVSPGSGPATINVAGGLTLGANALYVAELASNGSSDRLQATGTAALGGGGLELRFGPDRYQVGSTWRILGANALTGTFGDIRTVGGLGLMRARVDYGPAAVDVALVLDQDRFFSLAGSNNQRATAGAVAALPNSSALLNEVVWTPEAQIPGALDQISGELHATSATALFAAGRPGRTAVLRRLHSAAEGQAGVWGTASVFQTRYDGTGDLAGGRVEAQDFTAGADTDLSSTARVGASFAFGDLDLESEDRGQLSATHAGASLYGEVGLGRMIVRGGAGATWYDFDTERRVAFGAFNEELRGASDGRSGDLFVEAALPAVAAGVQIEPFLGLSTVALRLSGLQESGGEAAVSADEFSSTRSVATTGVRAYGEQNFNGGRMFVRGELGWEHALNSDRPTRTLSLSSTPDFSYRIEGLPAAEDSAILGLGLGVANGPWWFELSYDGAVAGSEQAHSGSATVRLAF